MRLTIQARNMSVSPAITQRIEKKTNTMSRYLLTETEMQVRMRKEKNDVRVVVRPTRKGTVIWSNANVTCTEVEVPDGAVQR